MSSQHTPSPWGVHGQTIFDYCGRGVIATCKPHGFHNPKETAIANAKRIKACVDACEGINPEAVPALLEACKAVVAWYENSGSSDPAPSSVELWAASRNALAKAQPPSHE